jgi:hypothetical protein
VIAVRQAGAQFAGFAMPRWLVVGALFLGGLAPASAQQKPPALNEAANAMVGLWELSTADHTKHCNVTFKGGHVKLGYRIEFDPSCAIAFPLVQRIAAWRYPENDLLYLLDAEGKAQIEFSEAEDGMFEAPTPGVGVLILQNPNAASRPIEDDEPPPGSDGG